MGLLCAHEQQVLSQGFSCIFLDSEIEVFILFTLLTQNPKKIFPLLSFSTFHPVKNIMANYFTKMCTEADGGHTRAPEPPAPPFPKPARAGTSWPRPGELGQAEKQ